ncbi:MAG: glycoside hydrolase family 2 TIM barrel-domain containing protein [Granulosicoccus sp.]
MVCRTLTFSPDSDPEYMMFLLRISLAVLLVSLSPHAMTVEPATESLYDLEPTVVSIAQERGRTVLLVNGQPFSVKGAGMGYSDSAGVSSLAAAGGNAFRTWDTLSMDAQLEAALQHDLMVLVGLDVGKQLQGFDYDDAVLVEQQHQRLLGVVERYRNHPSVLGWILGNEPNLMVNGEGRVIPANPDIYSAIGKLARDIKAVDPNHPTTVAFAFTATLADDIRSALQAAPDLDFVSLQAYGALSVIPQVVQDMKLPRPFMITEFGPLGHWEMPATEWGREIEEPSGHKAQGMLARMKDSVIDDPTGKLLGSFAFLWGHKQERTPTWYGLFLDTGERTASVDELTRVWTGSWPENRAPSVWSVTLQDQTADTSVRVKTSEPLKASAIINDPENDALIVGWELLNEVDERSHGGHFERRPDAVELRNARMTEDGERSGLVFDAPRLPGEYRLFVYARDEHRGGATANIPFLVTE